MTSEQQALLARLRDVADRRGWSDGYSQMEVSAGPRAFDVRCSEGTDAIWHWVGTADQIVGALEHWLSRRGLSDAPAAQR